MSQTLNLLLVEDSDDDAELLLNLLNRGGYHMNTTRVSDAAGMKAALARGDCKLIICDYSLPQFSGLAALELARASEQDIPFIIVSGHIGEEEAVAAMRNGAHDYVMKHNLSRLLPAIKRELGDAASRAARRLAEQRLREQELRLSAIISNIPGVIFQMLLSPDGRHAFSYVSEGSEALLGLSPDSLIANAQLFFDLVDAEDLPGLKACLAKTDTPASASRWEGRIRHRLSGERLWINLRFSPTFADNSGLRGEGLMTSITEIKLAEEEIRASRSRLAELSSHLERVKEHERARVAREIHDDIGGNLTAIKIDLMWLAGRPESATPTLTAKIRQIDALVDETIHTTTRIARDLRPGVLDLGLTAAIEWLAREFSNRMSIPCRLNAPREDPEIDPDTATAMFSIFRETLTNITKHAAASRVDVDLYTRQDNIVLRVSDNGRGITVADRGKAGSFYAARRQRCCAHRTPAIAGGDLEYIFACRCAVAGVRQAVPVETGHPCGLRTEFNAPDDCAARRGDRDLNPVCCRCQIQRRC